MKKWETPEITELKISETAFGPSDPTLVDSEKHQITNTETGEILGYEEEYGEPVSSNAN